MKQLIQYAALIALAVVRLTAQPQLRGVYNVASLQPGLPSGGGLAFITCSSPLGFDLQPGTYTADSSSPLPNKLGGSIELMVNINLGYAPILAMNVTVSGGDHICHD